MKPSEPAIVLKQRRLQAIFLLNKGLQPDDAARLVEFIAEVVNMTGTDPRDAVLLGV